MSTNPYLQTAQFLVEFKAGDQVAFRKLYDGTVAQISRMVSAKCHWAWSVEIEDFLADAYSEVYALRNVYEDYKHIVNSLTSIAYHNGIDYKRRMLHRWDREQIWMDMLGPMLDDPFTEQQSAQLVQIRQAVTRLEYAQRTVFELLFYQQKTVREIANQLCMREVVVYRHRREAIQSLRKLLDIKLHTTSRYDSGDKIVQKSYRAEVQKRYRERLKTKNFAIV
jgi:RNA polymerase sigma factor (sigma-70 family)